MEKTKRKLSELKPGDRGMVLSIEGKTLALALMRIGLVEGDAFTVSNLAPMGGPIALNIDGSKVAMRLSDAEKVSVQVEAWESN